MSNSGNSTPQFAAQASTAEDILKGQTVGLVQLDDFRKRRREVEDSQGHGSGTATPKTDHSDADNSVGLNFKKKRKTAGRKLLSFDNEEDAEDALHLKNNRTNPSDPETEFQSNVKRKFKSNPNAIIPAPKAMTKASIAAEASERDRLRSEFIAAQKEVRDADIAIPFVFYDGSSLPGGTVKVKKGEQIWLFLERCRKLGAEIGVSSEGSVEGGGTKARAEGKKSWARIGVDDLLLIRGRIIIPHHYEFYYFILNKIADPDQPEKLLFSYSALPLKAKDPSELSLLRRPGDQRIEGQDDDASYTKVVDRRWYERNKHIYPASLWREFKEGKDAQESLSARRDAQGNSFFFS